MKTIVAGSRSITDYEVVKKAIEKSGFAITEVVCGCAEGVDTLGARWGRANGIPVKMFPADWKKHGKAAGPIRNIRMANYADALIAVWDGASRGTEHMVRAAQDGGLHLYVANTSSPDVY